MALATFVPSLSEDGWILDPLKMGDYIIAHAFASDFSQTEIYNGYVTSIAYLIHKYQGDLPGLFSAIETTLTTYLNRYFTNIVVQASEYPNPKGSSLIGINLYVSYVGADGATYTLSKLIQTLNSIVTSIININNNG